MRSITLNLGERSYAVKFGYDVIKNLGRYVRRLNLGNHAYIITNRLIKRKYGRVIQQALEGYGIGSVFDIIADSESSKSLSTSLKVIQRLAGFDKKRRVFVIAFGGGVVGDLSGFIAAIYKRGIPYIQVPTTLLACVDSSIGGKTGVDLQFGKNLVGAFYQPRLVVSELSFLKSLSLRQIRSGLAEVIKYAVIKDRKLFRYLEQNYSRLLNLEKPVLSHIVNCCVRIKAAIVQRDEREQAGIRTILNFGHTLGHAIEAAGGYRGYNHGEAVALGMILAGRISNRLKLLSRAKQNRIEDLIRKSGLPVFIKGLSLRKIIAAHYRDKKFIADTNRLVLIKDIGRTVIKKNIALGIIESSLCERMSPRR